MTLGNRELQFVQCVKYLDVYILTVVLGMLG